jgi:hypothetical protein
LGIGLGEVTGEAHARKKSAAARTVICVAAG